MSEQCVFAIWSKQYIKYVYCLDGGDIDNAGLKLFLFYKKPEKVKQLIDNGSMYTLGSRCVPPKNYFDSYEECAEYVETTKGFYNLSICDYAKYHNETHNKYKGYFMTRNLESLFYEIDPGVVRVYCFATDEWFVCTDKNNAFSLSRLICENLYYKEFKKHILKSDSMEVENDAIVEWQQISAARRTYVEKIRGPVENECNRWLRSKKLDYRIHRKDDKFELVRFKNNLETYIDSSDNVNDLITSVCRKERIGKPQQPIF